MAKVEGVYPDVLAINNQAYFKLTCDKIMFPGYWTAPIKWTGYVNDKKVVFYQTTVNSYDAECFDFSSFSSDIEVAIPYIIDAINKAMRVMN